MRVRCRFLNPIGSAAKINFPGFNVREYSCVIAAARLALVKHKMESSRRLGFAVVTENTRSLSRILRRQNFRRKTLIQPTIPRTHVCEALRADGACVPCRGVLREARRVHGMPAPHKYNLLDRRGEILRTYGTVSLQRTFNAWVGRGHFNRHT
jgi:hypothetical protein